MKFINVVTVAVLFSMLAACGRVDNQSSLRSVDVPQTHVKAQNKIGFCWSYATMGLLESLSYAEQEKLIRDILEIVLLEI